MAKILEYRELPLADLLVDKGQLRTQDAVASGIIVERLRTQGPMEAPKAS